MFNSEEVNRVPVLIWNKSVDGYQEFNDLLKAIRNIEVIGKYLETHVLVNEQITNNDCYKIETHSNVTYVYLKERKDFLLSWT